MREVNWKATLEFVTEEEIAEIAKSGAAFAAFRRAYGDLYLMAKGYNAGCIDLFKCKGLYTDEPSVRLFYATDEGTEFIETIAISKFVETLKGYSVEFSYKIRPRE